MISANASGQTRKQQNRTRSISVDDVGDVSHNTSNNDYDDANDFSMKHYTSPTNGSRSNSGHSLPVEEYRTKPHKNRRTSRTPKSTDSTVHSHNAGSDTNDTHNINNIDPLMGSMEFEESQASFAIDENVVLPGGLDAGPGGLESHASSSSSSDDSSQSSDCTNSLEKRRAAHKKSELTIGQKETLALRRTRSTLFGFIMAIAIIGAITISMITVQNEISSFERDFTMIGETIIEHMQQQMQLQYQSFDTLSNDIMTLVQYDSGSNTVAWPFVTIPSSSSILERYMSILHASLVCIYPIVPAAQRTQWEQYATLSQGWIDDDLQNTMISIDTMNTTITSAGNSRRTLLDGSTETTSSNVFQPMSIPDSDSIPPYIHGTNNIPLVINASGTYAVWWQYAPIIADRSIINLNAMTSTIQSMVLSTTPFTTMSPVQYVKDKKKKKVTSNDYETDDDVNATTAANTLPSSSADEIIDTILQKQGSYSSGEPFSYIYYPIVNTTTSGSAIVAVMSAAIEWKTYLEHAISKGHGIVCVIHQRQNANDVVHDDHQETMFSFEVDADHDKVTFLGYEDLHDPNFDHIVVSYNVTLETNDTSYAYTGVPYNNDITSYTIYIYPTKDMKDSYTTLTSVQVAAGMLFCFILTLGVFCYYDSIVAKRQKIVMDNAYKTYNIVSSLFPATVRDRMIQDSTVHHENGSSKLGRSNHLQQLLVKQESTHSDKTKFDPSTAIADFYPSATVLFSDITGFTAWCASREPSQVFILLETIYSAYDTIAKKRKVFKVETIGDCYMAVVGLPEPRVDHAVVMCRFARQCLSKLRGILSDLEETLGPGTADLNMRFGLHSGPVTAGVLRSQNARFQLFGDTVNTAARMESNGSPGMIHISQETANELTAQGKQGWFYPRSEKITAKGKGELQTYWVDLSVSSIDDRMSTSSSSIRSSLSLQQGNGKNDRRLKRTIGGQDVVLADVQICRLVDWVLDTMNPMLCRIVARRLFIESQQGQSTTTGAISRGGGQTIYGPNIMDDIISEGLPTFDDFNDPNSTATYDELPLDTKISEQLHDYVHLIASRYNNENTYHNFEHAASAIMTIVSFLSRITNALKFFIESGGGSETPNEQIMSMLYHMRNIFDDPITSFACVLAGLVHDVDHNGDPKSVASLSLKANGSSEQNAIHVAWSLLLQPEFKLLRQAIFGSSTNDHGGSRDSDLNRFRYVFVRSVLATDIHPAHNRNNAKYNPSHSALSQQQPTSKSHRSEMIDALLRVPSEIMGKAMTMIEYMMQLSDIGHLIQQWPIYMKWNERLFNEYLKYYTTNNMIKMSKRRSSSSDSVSSTRSQQKLQHPSVYWYETELRYMKEYVMPLTEKICAEFSGIMSIACSMSSESGPMCQPKNLKCSKEYLVAITQLLSEWTLRGPTIIDEMASNFMGQRQPQHPSNKISSNSSVNDSNSIMNVSSILLLQQLHDQPLMNSIHDHSQASADVWLENISTVGTQPQQQQHLEKQQPPLPQQPMNQINTKYNSTDHSGKNVTKGRNMDSSHVSPAEMAHRRTRPQPQHLSPPPLQRSKSNTTTSSQNPFTFL